MKLFLKLSSLAWTLIFLQIKTFINISICEYILLRYLNTIKRLSFMKKKTFKFYFKLAKQTLYLDYITNNIVFKQGKNHHVFFNGQTEFLVRILEYILLLKESTGQI